MARETATLLLVDSDSEFRNALVEAFHLVGYTAKGAGSGEAAWLTLTQKPVDLVLLDIHLPDTPGVDLIWRIRRAYSTVQIIILTNYATVESAIEAVKLTVADYLLKPLETQQIIDTVANVLREKESLEKKHLLLNRISSVVKGLGPPNLTSLTGDSQVIYVAPLLLDCEANIVIADDNPATILTLTQKETRILANLMRHSNQVIPNHDLAELAWGSIADGDEAAKIVRPFMSRLRRKLQQVYGKKPLIHTVRRSGYLFMSTQKR